VWKMSTGLFADRVRLRPSYNFGGRIWDAGHRYRNAAGQSGPNASSTQLAVNLNDDEVDEISEALTIMGAMLDVRG